MQSDGQSANWLSEVAQDDAESHNQVIHSVQDDQSNPASYVGSTHWSAVLNDLLDLKALLHFSPEIQNAQYELPVRAPHLSNEPIFGAFSSFSLDRIISEFLPAKVDVNRLLSHYFQGPVFIIPMLHKYQFQRQYREFWANPMEVKPLWLSILFSVCYISAEVRKITDPTGPPLKESFTENSFLHTAAGQCLVLGEYNRPQKLAVEALAMYAQSKHVQTLDPSREAGVILSMAVRNAYHLGYHRDPDISGRFTVFEGEMRRRCWAICKQMDLMTSFELGLPSNICMENCDTKSPRNLLDSDFDEDTQELPTSRSENEATRQLWFIVKDRMMVSFSKVCRDALSFSVKSEADVVQLDQEIRQMYATIPQVLRVRDMSESVTESPFIIFTRIYVEFIYLKCQCVLHRRYMARGNASSTTCCINAGKRLVSQFIDISKEFSPGGQLYMQHWMLTNYTMNDFLLGVMVLCFALYIGRNKHDQSLDIDTNTKQEILTLLESSHTILVDKSASCKDARRVAHIVRQILDSTKKSPKPASSVESPPGVAKNLGIPQPQILGSDGSEPFSGPLEPLTFMNNSVGDFDWTMFDPEVLNQESLWPGHGT
ncbi:MAG: hypothetical protein LQ342_005838 [Letrouitia transgressa]|nr:MAG: hypothetical protein LQ342_005838 [Letrouitia transgressa]